MIERRHSYTAFTLVELLIAVGITTLIVVMLGIMFASLTSTSSRANQRTDAFRDARAALQMIQRDLSGLVRNQRDATGQPLTRPAAYFALKNLYTDPVAVNSATDNQQIYALIAAKNSGSGDLCSVGFYCRWDNSKHTYTLHRFFNPSENASGKGTYSRFMEPAVAAANYASESDLYDLSLAGASDEILASYVWNLRITAYDSAGNTITTYPYVCDPSAAGANPLPAAIEIAFKAMSSEAARTVMTVTTDPNDWMDETRTNYIRLIKPNAYEFRTRIKL